MYDDHEERKGLWNFSWLRFAREKVRPRVPNKRFGAVSRNYFSSRVLLKWMLFLVLLVFSPSEAQKRYVQVIL